MRCCLRWIALVWVDWQIACGLGCSGGVAIRRGKRGWGVFLFVCTAHAAA